MNSRNSNIFSFPQYFIDVNENKPIIDYKSSLENNGAVIYPYTSQNKYIKYIKNLRSNNDSDNNKLLYRPKLGKPQKITDKDGKI